MNSIPSNEKTTCVILSGGLSSRMKTHKALLRYSENENFLQRIINVYRNTGIRKIIVVKNHNIDITQNNTSYNADIIENHSPEKGRLYSIQLGLLASSGTDYCYLQNVDNPFVTHNLIVDLYNSRSKGEYISPQYENRGGHPILISNTVIKGIIKNDNQNRTLHEALDVYNRFKLNTWDKNCLLNINHPADYDNIFLKSAKQDIV